MTDDNPFRRGLLGLPPLPTNSLLGDLPYPLQESPLAALARKLYPTTPPPPSPSTASLLANALLGQPPAPPRMTDLSALAKALYPDPPAVPNAFSGLGGAMTDPPMRNALTGYLPQMTDPAPYNLFNPAPPPKPYLPPVNRTPSTRNLPDVRRRTFFSFQYDDIMRVNQVRKSWMIRPASNDPRAPLWFHDSSIWEKSKETDDAKLARLILDGLDRTSVTCVLAGEETWSRPWVRFEIAASVKRGNGLLTVYIHAVKCPNNGHGNPGLNPLDFIGVYEKPTGGYFLCEKGFDGQWYQYDRIKGPVPWPKYLPKASARNVAQPLSAGTKAYDYAKNGYANLSLWVQAAAVAAGK